MKIVVASIFFFVFILNGFSQSNEDALFFSDDLNAIANLSNINIEPYFDHELRADVARFIPSDSALIIRDNQRDTALSVAFWFRPENIDNHSGTLIGEDSIFYFRYLSNRQLQFNHYYKKDINTAGVLTDNVWQHLGFTIKKNGELVIYLNGDQILKDSISSNWWTKKSAITVGKDLYKVDAEGSIDELRIWSRALSSKKIQQVFMDSQLVPDLDYQLASYLPLSVDFTDISSEPRTILEKQNIKFVKDSIKGLVADFYKDDSHITLSDFSFDNQMTISVWVKPTNKEWMMALAGNRDFSFRYTTKQGQMWFNVPMVYSCRSCNQEVISGDWVHLAIVLSYNHKADFYRNGQLIDTKKIQGKTGKDKSITIGQSIWGNTFNGQMTKFAIWNRSLTDSEIRAVYNGKLDVVIQKTSKIPYAIYVSILALVLLLISLFLWRMTRIKLRKSELERVKKEEIQFELPKKNALYLFETFRAFDKEGKDISHDFTPTLIRLFSLILLFPRVYNRNITSQEMSDILWDTDDVAQQKNNRGTNIHRLRSLLKQFDSLALVYRNKEWIIDNSKHLFVDLIHFDTCLLEGRFNLPFKKICLCKPIKN